MTNKYIKSDNLYDTTKVEIDVDNDDTIVIHTPIDFIEYIFMFWQYKIAHVGNILNHIKRYENMKKLVNSGIDNADSAKAREWLKDHTEEEYLAWVVEFSDQFVNYGIKTREEAEAPKIPLSKINKDLELAESSSERLIFDELFSGELWSIFEYLQKSNSYEHMIQSLQQLVVDTAHKELPNTDFLLGLNLEEYKRKLKPSNKVSKQALKYGKYLVLAAATYAHLRKAWLDSNVIDYDIARNLERQVALAAQLGHHYHDLRYGLNCGDGGTKKGEEYFDEAKKLLYKYYLKLYKKKISAAELVNEMYEGEEMINSPEYIKLARQGKSISNEVIIAKLVRKWDKEKGINRRKYRKPKTSKILKLVG